VAACAQPFFDQFFCQGRRRYIAGSGLGLESFDDLGSAEADGYRSHHDYIVVSRGPEDVRGSRKATHRCREIAPK
jgi:hypothetical protein